MIKPTKIHYIASITLLLLFLAGCGKAENHVVALPEPEDTLKTEVETSYKDSWSDMYGQEELIWYDSQDETTWGIGARYYGTVDGAEIFYIPVAGYAIMVQDGNDRIYVDKGIHQYVEGHLAPLSGYAGDKGWSEKMQKAMELHRTYSEKIKRGSVFAYENAQGLGKLSSREQKAVETAWWNTYNSELSWTFEGSQYKFFGNYGGTVVIYWYCPDLLSLPIPWGVGGVGFSHHDELWACRDGEVVELTEAYERGWLDEEDLLVVRGYCDVVEEKRR